MLRRSPALLVGLGLLLLGAAYAAAVGPGFALTMGDDYAYASTTVDLCTGAPLVRHFDSPAWAALYVPVSEVPGAYASKFPLGASLLLVPFYLAAGFRGLFALGPLLAVVTVVCTYLLAWQIEGRRDVALLAAALLASLPPTFMSAASSAATWRRRPS